MQPGPSPRHLGIAAGLAASTIWGFAPAFFDLLAHVPLGEILAHRILWAAVSVGLWCWVTGRWPRIRAALRDPGERRVLVLSALLITLNWFTFIWAVGEGRVTESGIGYYLMPLVSVALGVAVLGERLSPRRWAAVALAGTAVAVLTLGLGAAPVVPVVLAVSFAVYGLIRKRASVGAIVGFQVETLVLTLPALAWAFWAALGSGGGQGFGLDWTTTLLLMAAGPMTGVPLILFAEAARRLPLGTVGLVQYVNPTLQVAVAALILGETLTIWHWIALTLIWVALAFYSTGRDPQAVR